MTPLSEQQQQEVPCKNETDYSKSKKAAVSTERFPTSLGYTTAQTRLDYIDALGLSDDDDDDEIPKSLIAKSIQAKNNKIYPWQLFSLLGSKRIETLIRHFYTRVYDDKQDRKFRKAFTQIAHLDHHVYTQVSFWIDAMGGGRRYHGGDSRLQFHHHRNAGPRVMNADGATRWMHHMRLALHEVQDDWNALDERIVPCVWLFLKIKMQKYAHQHEWVFDEGDFPE